MSTKRKFTGIKRTPKGRHSLYIDGEHWGTYGSEAAARAQLRTIQQKAERAVKSLQRSERVRKKARKATRKLSDPTSSKSRR